MSKQTVFISHSSNDSAYLSLLKELLRKKTGGVLEVFLSSDGQSIPCGTNWIHSVETALEKATVMFVAVSPNSLTSSWLCFESGYAYARKIKVIPIGIMGLNLSDAPSPLRLLQGFNLNSYEGLNNLITVINREYHYEFPEDFSKQDFENLQATNSNKAKSLAKWAKVISNLTFSLPQSIENEKYTDKRTCLVKDRESVIEDSLDRFRLLWRKTEENEFDFRLKKTYLSAGIYLVSTESTIKTVVADGRGKSKQIADDNIFILLDPFAYENCILFLFDLIQKIYTYPLQRYYFIINFSGDVHVLTENYKIFSRVAEHGISLSKEKDNGFKLDSIEFSISASQIILLIDLTEGKMPNVAQLLELLWTTGVISKKDNPTGPSMLLPVSPI